MKPGRLKFSQCSDAGDLPDIVHLARLSHVESRMRDIPFSPAKVEAIALKAFEKKSTRAVFIARKNDVPVGFAYCSIGEYHIGSEMLLTSIHNLNAEKSHRKGLLGGKIALGLFRGVETWSQARNASQILFHVTSGMNLRQSHSFVKRLGYQFIGGSYAKNI